jgi:hypothetical protein
MARAVVEVGSGKKEGNLPANLLSKIRGVTILT